MDYLSVRQSQFKFLLAAAVYVFGVASNWKMWVNRRRNRVESKDADGCISEVQQANAGCVVESSLEGASDTCGDPRSDQENEDAVNPHGDLAAESVFLSVGCPEGPRNKKCNKDLGHKSASGHIHGSVLEHSSSLVGGCTRSCAQGCGGP